MADDKNRLGERVDITALPSTPLPQSGLSLGYPGQPPPKPGQGPEQYVDPANYTKPFTPPNTGTVPEPAVPRDRRAARTPVPPLEPQNVPSRAESDTIKQLREKFGIRRIGVRHFEFGGFKWTFRVPSKVDINWAVVLLNDVIPMAHTVSDEDLEAGIIPRSSMLNYSLRTALTAVSIAAIDDVPLYKHFGLAIDESMVRDPMFPPRSVRLAASEQMYELLADDSMNTVSEGLEEFYLATIDPLVSKVDRGPLAQEQQET